MPREYPELISTRFPAGTVERMEKICEKTPPGGPFYVRQPISQFVRTAVEEYLRKYEKAAK